MTHTDYIVLPSTHANILCLVLREAVTNVIRHADATVCRLELHHDGDLLIMRVEDNGSGKLGAEGNGLSGMRERIASAGGILLRERSADGGTRLTTKLPLPSVTLQIVAPSLFEKAATAFLAVEKGKVRA